MLLTLAGQMDVLFEAIRKSESGTIVLPKRLVVGNHLPPRLRPHYNFFDTLQAYWHFLYDGV